ncbi:hypothetical protein [Spirosoma fluminis]
MNEMIRNLLTGERIAEELFVPTNYTQEQAEAANDAFDSAVKQFLRDWIENGTTVDPSRSFDTGSCTETFIEQGALRSFFKHYEDAFEQLLREEAIARHLLRPIEQVYFLNDAYEPMLARFEQRIYNLAAHREHREVPFRYTSASRQGDHGDTIVFTEHPDWQGREDIGMYFGTRRSDTTALNILADQLHQEAAYAGSLPIHVMVDGYMEDALRAVRTSAERLQQEGHELPHCFIIQRRHAADDRHLGGALLIMNPQQPALPQRVIFCDTLNPSGQPPWWERFQHKLDAVFPQPEGQQPASAMLEDGSVKLQRLHDGVPVRHQDIDCAFYTASIGRALIQLAKVDPDLLIYGPIEEIVGQMTSRMVDYYECAHQPKAPTLVREVNVTRRWNTGRQAIRNIRQRIAHEQAVDGLLVEIHLDQRLAG